MKAVSSFFYKPTSSQTQPRSSDDHSFELIPLPDRTIVEQYAVEQELPPAKFPYFKDFEDHLKQSKLNPNADANDPEKFATRRYQELTILERIYSLLVYARSTFVRHAFLLIPLMDILLNGNRDIFSYQAIVADYLNRKNAESCLKRGLENLGVSKDKIPSGEQLEKIYEGRLEELKSDMAKSIYQRSSTVDEFIEEQNRELFKEFTRKISELERERYSVVYGPPRGFPEGRLPRLNK